MNKTIHPSNTEAFYNLNPEQREWIMAGMLPADPLKASEPFYSYGPPPDNATATLSPKQRKEYEANKLQINTVLGANPAHVDYASVEEYLADEAVPIKFDQNKVDWAILPLDATEEIIKVFQFGEQKYARGNFANGDGLAYTRMLNSLMRHTTSFMRGEDLDPESGLSHMGHAGACVLMLLHFITHKDQFPNNDDRAGKIL